MIYLLYSTGLRVTELVDLPLAACNLNACFVLSRLVAPHMFEHGSGSIVNVASVHGLVASAPNLQVAYDSSKHGLIGLTRGLAGQWARRGVRVNALAPGYFETELTAALASPAVQAAIRALGGVHVTVFEWSGRTQQRVIQPWRALASEAGSYMSGAVVTVDGGWTAR